MAGRPVWPLHVWRTASIHRSMMCTQRNGSQPERNSVRLPPAASGDTQFKTYALLQNLSATSYWRNKKRILGWGQENSSTRFNNFRWPLAAYSWWCGRCAPCVSRLDVIWGCREKAPRFTHIIGKSHSLRLCDIVVSLPSTKGHSFRAISFLMETHRALLLWTSDFRISWRKLCLVGQDI